MHAHIYRMESGAVGEEHRRIMGNCRRYSLLDTAVKGEVQGRFECPHQNLVDISAFLQSY